MSYSGATKYAGVESVAEMRAPINIFAAGDRRRISIISLCANLLLPWLLFCGLYAAMSFNLHYTSKALPWALVAVGFGVSILTGIAGYRAKQRDGDHTWYSFTALALFKAVALAAVFGDMNFWYHMQPYYDIENLNTYPSVNPSREKGQQVMDAGRVYFSVGTKLDKTKAVAFKNSDVYCAAPIVIGKEKLPSYDFWAVGVNCCSGVPDDFRCGEHNNPNARSGLRLVRDDQRAFFRLAVQQAEAAYSIKASHPVFFYWLQDPIAEMNSYRDEGFRHYLMGIFAHFLFNAFCVMSAVVGFSKIGRK